jgi:hypothetical protein
MAIDYSSWPVAADVTALLASANITPGAGLTADLIALRLASATQEITQRTHRQFLPSTETRNFDGSGSGEMLVDEYVGVTAITLYLVPSVGVTDVTQFVEVERSTYPKTRLQIYQGPSNAPYGWFTYFPQGRSNVGVTATWGYGATIPPDVWQAVLYKSAADCAEANRMTDRGLLTSVRDDDQTEQYKADSIGQSAGWLAAFESACERYKRPLRQFIGRKRPPLL